MKTSIFSRAARVAFIQAEWHKDLLENALEGFLRRMVQIGVPIDAVDFFEVPGAFEIPLFDKRIATRGDYAAIIGSALVVDGGIYRHEFVAQAVVEGLMRVQLETDTPVFSMVLTPHNFRTEEHMRGFFAKHLIEKGDEVADARVRAVGCLERLGGCMSAEAARHLAPGRVGERLISTTA
ncbi:6,7-dimethyl-8-ribityllumazine synthase [Cupriavidus taiwanensis]|uniref:6,7-dimethyl-8-ribityllumazine synthase n=1 Tax=Cupriavidus taiwanensis TaxID=164546 RepID=A0A375JAZ4_9BURK|nr:6,7-dimethyl-8-ribityllumazine synthase [Cupriavidus taiwanensis]SPS02365.1 6,7-dimethyl-8-ribityllumazine synthase (DMRL synthase) (Lumazine synthase) (Riboflavin synthase beta chain) [Cupriavidus taiwanensis]